MRLSMLSRMAALLVFAGLSAGLAHAQQDSSQQPATDPVAEAARKTREELKTAPKPKVVFTNDNLPTTPTKDTAAQPASPAAGAQADTSSSGGKDDAENDPKSEAYWRKRFQKQRDKISSTEQEIDVLQRELNKDQVQYYNDPQKAMQQQYSRSDINDKTAKVEAKKKELEALKQQLSDMEDDLRKAGGDPGWAR
jgi:broad specificity polyphosphatase/5'/3'-nucleotidase SurE